jgi:hypothetical protein
MANVKKGQLTSAPQRWRHLKDWKKVFWSQERMATKTLVDDELYNDGELNDLDIEAALPKKRQKKRFGMEYRYHQEFIDFYPRDDFQWLWGKRREEWRPFYTWYETAKQRDQAMEAMNKKKFLDKCLYHEYRPTER